MGDYQLRARLPHELADDVKEVVEWLNETVPEAEVTMSTISRYALKEYVRKSKLVREENGLLLELPLKGLTSEEVASICKSVEAISKVITNKNIDEAKSILKSKVETLELFELIEKKKAEQKRGVDS